MVIEIEKCKGVVFKASNGGEFIITTYIGCNEVYIKFLETGYEDFPDIEIGGPGFCFPIWRWNGEKYEFKRNIM